MSKFLKVIVNLFLICAILIAGALLVPPLAGISTTMIDSSYMASNLPIGSVTYSQKVSVTEIAENDTILVETDSEIHAYTVESVDAGTGSCVVSDAKQTQAESKELQLREVSKILVTIPMIGYIMIAMRSIEGIIIIGLVVLFVIILFILSELWKTTDDDDDEDDEEDDEKDDIEESEDKVHNHAPPAEESVEDDRRAYVEPTTELTMDELAQSVAEIQNGGQETAEDPVVVKETADTAAESVDEAASAEQVQAELDLSDLQIVEDDDRNSFVPVARPTKEEILKKAGAAGEEPTVMEFDHLDVTIIDYSDII